MKRDRAYRRKMCQKHINRKKRIITNKSPFFNYWDYKFEGQLNKGKIHCSCSMCRKKTAKTKATFTGNKNWKHSDLIKIERLKEQVKERDEELNSLKNNTIIVLDSIAA